MSYYSLIYHRFKINNRINVGLIMWNDTESKVYFKLNPTNNDLKNDSFQALRKGLRDTNVNELNEKIKRLSIYQNGYIGVDKPNLITIELTNENFNKLYNKFI